MFNLVAVSARVVLSVKVRQLGQHHICRMCPMCPPIACQACLPCGCSPEASWDAKDPGRLAHAARRDAEPESLGAKRSREHAGSYSHRRPLRRTVPDAFPFSGPCGHGFLARPFLAKPRLSGHSLCKPTLASAACSCISLACRRFSMKPFLTRSLDQRSVLSCARGEV